MGLSKTKFSLQEFLAMPESGDRAELIDGEIITKVSPKYKHASVQGRLYRFIDNWCAKEQCGRVCPEWAVVLNRKGGDWVPVPDLTYVSFERLSADWQEDEPSPVLPELVIEIISPGQSFGEMTSKASDYLRAGVDRVWVVDNQAQSITVFGNSKFPQTFWINDTISDSLLPELAIALTDIFAKNWDGQEPCPGIPQLVVEIISPGQSFGGMTSKATDYLLAGVDRVWVVDSQAQSLTVFGANEFPQTFWVNDTISDSLLPGLAIPVNSLFTKTGGRTPDANESQ